MELEFFSLVADRAKRNAPLIAETNATTLCVEQIMKFLYKIGFEISY
jgi:hypothetical protein